jgi:hypothetical protein
VNEAAYKALHEAMARLEQDPEFAAWEAVMKAKSALLRGTVKLTKDEDGQIGNGYLDAR